jgi:protein-tyrosine phosphatase
VSTGLRPRSQAVRASRSYMAAIIRAALTHSVAMILKRYARNVRWSVSGSGVRNPAMPHQVRSVLFVCLGNICRSPFGALLAERFFREAGLGYIRCSSAGIRTSQAARSPADAVTAARHYGIDLDDHLPRQLDRDLVAAHDVVMVMEASQLRELQAAYPEFRDRILLMPLYDDSPAGAYERCNLSDPFGQPIEVFEACYARIDRVLRCWVAAVNAHQGPGELKN